MNFVVDNEKTVCLLGKSKVEEEEERKKNTRKERKMKEEA